jgi:RNA polymerase sigma-70 factor (ECF subfamily)
MSAPNEQRFLELVNGSKPKLLRVCRAYASNRADQDALYQEIHFQMWRALPDRKDQTFLLTWLYRVALNTAISFVCKNRTRAARTVKPADERRETLENARQPDSSHNGPIARLYTAIAQLSNLEKALATLYLESLSYEEIAAVMGISAGKVGVILLRLKQKLSTLIGEANHE